MSQENVERRRLVRLHRNLEGKRILFIESYPLYKSVQNDFTFQRIELRWKYELPKSDDLGRPIRLIDYMNQEFFDGLIIHPGIQQSWVQAIDEVYQGKMPIVVILGEYVGESWDVYQKWKNLDIPLVQKLNGATVLNSNELLEALDKQFAAKLAAKGGALRR